MWMADTELYKIVHGNDGEDQNVYEQVVEILNSVQYFSCLSSHFSLMVVVVSCL